MKEPVYKPMSVRDRIFLSSDTDQVFIHMGGLAIFCSPYPGFAGDLVARMRTALSFNEPFNFRPGRCRRRQVWEVLADGEINLDHHLVHTALPAPGTRRQLESAIARIHSRPLDPDKPLWEFHVIEGLESNRIALYAKVHHALMDAMILMGLFAQMTSVDPDDQQLQPFWVMPLPGRDGTARQPSDRLAILRQLGTQGMRFLREARHPTDSAFAVPMAGPHSRLLNGRVSRRRSFATQSFDEDRIRRLAARAGASINEIFLAALSGALRQYVGQREGLPGRGLLAAVPVASRSGAAHPRHNAGALVVVNLFTDQSDPGARLDGIRRSSALAMQHLGLVSPQAADVYAYLTFGPYILLELTGLSGRVRSPYNVTVSNVAGPKEPRYLLGATQEELYGLTNLGHGQRLSMTVLSAGGRMGVGFTGCGEALADVDRLADLLADQVSELETALGVRL